MDSYRAYTFRKSRNKRIIRNIGIVYILFITIRLISIFFIGEVIKVNPQYYDQYGERFFKASKKASKKTSERETNLLQKQKLLVVKTFLIHRISEQGFSFKKQPLHYNDMVLVSLLYPKYSNNSFFTVMKNVTRNILNIISIGIIQKHGNPFVLRKVVGVPGDVVAYSSNAVISVNGPSLRNIYKDDNDIPFLDQVREVVLKEDEYFLVGRGNFELDDTVFGATTLPRIKGKGVVLLGQRWGFISPFLQ